MQNHDADRSRAQAKACDDKLIGWDHPIATQAGLVSAEVVADSFGYDRKYFLRVVKQRCNAPYVTKINKAYYLHIKSIGDIQYRTHR